MKPLLNVVALKKGFGGVRAIEDIYLEVFPGQILSIIGPNGAGKTTLFNVLTGIYRADEGEIYLNEEKINGFAPHEICRKGLARTFQNIRLFGDMTAFENVLVGDFQHDPTSWWQLMTRTPSFRREQQAAFSRAENLLHELGLKYHENILARHLSYGFQRRLEIARALATQPKALLLDEPGAGMNATELNELVKIIRKIKEMGIAVVLIEHHMKMVMEISDDVIVLDHGEEIAKGKPEDIRKNPQVISAYLGDALST